MTNKLYSYFLKQQTRTNDNYLIKWIRWRLFNYLKKALLKHYINFPLSQLKIDPKSNMIVSLTSFPDRINSVHLAIKSVLNQTYRPSKVVLWLGEEYFPNKENDLPSHLLDLKSVGLEIVFCEDLKPHTKYFYAFQKFSKNLIVTIDDDMFYPEEMLNQLNRYHELYPDAVIANRIREISYNGSVLEHYRKWRINSYENGKPSKKLLATGVGGVLYQPTMFSAELFDKSKIRELALNVDDIWLKANQLKSDVDVVWTNYYYQPFIEISDSQTTNLNATNVFEGDNNYKIKNIFFHYGINKNTFQ